MPKRTDLTIKESNRWHSILEIKLVGKRKLTTKELKDFKILQAKVNKIDAEEAKSQRKYLKKSWKKHEEVLIKLKQVVAIFENAIQQAEQKIAEK